MTALPMPESRPSISSETPEPEKVSYRMISLSKIIETSEPPRYTFWKYPRLRPFSVPVSATASPITPVVNLITEVKDVPVLARQVPLPIAIIACMLCVLIGSLIRSFLSEADFIVYLPADVVPSGEWRDLRRLVQLRIWPGRDFVVAIAR